MSARPSGQKRHHVKSPMYAEKRTGHDLGVTPLATAGERKYNADVIAVDPCAPASNASSEGRIPYFLADLYTRPDWGRKA